MSAPVFNQVDSTLAYALSTLADTGLANYWAGYFAGPSSNLGSSANTTAVWQDTGGFYLFLAQTPPDWSVFSASLSALLPAIDPQHNARCMWIGNVQSPSLQWQITTLFASYAGSGATIAWTSIRACSFLSGGYQMLLSGLSPMTYITDGDGGGIGFSGGGSFIGPEGGYNFSSAQMLFSGATLGALSATMNIPAPANAQAADLWTTLSIGLQYAAAPGAFSDDTSLVSQAEADEDPELLYASATDILFMPVFTRQTAALTLGLLFDPLNWFVSSRTALSLFPSGGTPPAFSSYLRTTRGYQVQLDPLAASGSIPAAQFVFGYCPVDGDDSDGVARFHLSPDGAFQATIVNPPQAGADTTIANQLLLGLSGLEYAELGGTNYMIVFRGGQPAFIPAVNTSQSTAPDISQALTTAATTSHMNVLAYGGENSNPVYFAQPREAPVFSGRGHRSDGILDFNPMPAFQLVYGSQQLPPVFPWGIYAGLTSDETAIAQDMENASLAPYRNYCIGNAYGVTSMQAKSAVLPVPKRRLRDVNDPLGVTPQGLIAELTPDYEDYDGLIIGNMPGTAYPSVDLTAVEGLFKQTLQSNQLFFVAANVDVLMSGTSVRYMLTDLDKDYLSAMNVPPQVIADVYAAVAGKQPFETEGDFVSCIQSAAGDYLDDFLQVGGILKVEMDGWTFQLSPRSWRTDPETPTLMIAKFCNRTLLDLANDSSSWLWPEVSTPANGTLKQTQTVLLDLLNAAGDPDASASLRIFYDTVATNVNWNGFLFLNAPVDIGEMPDDLKFLTAGINLSEFYAHHIGFSQTPFSVQNGNPQLEQTAAFGLIDYEDPEDLYADETIPFGFKTITLRARFANAALVDFSAEVELMLNQLLGAALSKAEAARGNNLIIDGSYQRVGGAPSYAFTLTGQNVFNANDSALVSIEVLSVQLVNGGNPGSVNVLTTFVLMGNLRFIRIEEFDMFSFGPGEDDIDAYLRYSGLSIDMSFSLADPAAQTFVVRESNTAFDLSNSVQRPSSLMNNFPLTVSALAASPNLSAEGETPSGQTPEEMGYTSISIPVDQTPMVPSWYGLVFSLDLGTFGALTGSVSFKISILTAWSKSESQGSIKVYLGLKLPSISAVGGSFPLQGVLKLGFRNFQFETYTNSQGLLAYQLRMHRFALSVLVWSFPPGNFDIVLFGQPGNPKGSLGWYAAYKKDSSSSSAAKQLPQAKSAGKKTRKMNTGDPVQRRLISGRRKPRIG